MKTYQEMIQFVVDQVDNGKIRYHEWVVIPVISEMFGVDAQLVYYDIDTEKEYRKLKESARRRQESQNANEARRLANLASAASND